MNLLETLTLFGTVALAAPIGLLGVEFLLGGRTVVGAGFLAVALALVAGGYFRPSVKSILAGTATEVVADDETDERNGDAAAGDEEAYKYRG